MKFKIKHETKAFQYGIGIPWIVGIVTVLIFILMGFTILEERPVMVLFGILIMCGTAEIIFIFLFLAEKVFGAKIIIEADHVDVRLLLRRKILRFDDIADSKYRHYYDREESKQSSFSILFSSDDVGYSLGPRVRSQIIFYLLSGKVFKVNDKSTNYEWKRKLWLTNPEIDPDEDVKLYQAYKCYRASWDIYYNEDNGIF